MKTIRTAAVSLLITVIWGAPLLAQSGNDLYQQALVMERAEGDVQGAIELYQRIVREFAADRSLSAKALVQMGLCYEKLGLTDAQQAYQQVIDGFPEQEDEVALARERLAILARALADLEPSPNFRKIRIPGSPENGILSPDGTQLSFVSGGSLWTVPVQGRAAPDVAGEPVRLTGPMEAWNEGNVLTWSGDGRWIAFNGAEGWDDEIFVIPSAGGEPIHVPVTRAPIVHYSQLRLALSPDGSTLAYAATDLAGPDVAPGVPSVDLYAVSVQGDTPTRLTSGGTGLNGQPAFSPDGRFIAYVNAGSTPEGDWQVRVVPREGGTPIRFSNVPGRARSPIWSPDGRYLAFSYLPGPDDESQEVWVVPVSRDGAPAGDPTVIPLPLVNVILLAGWTANNELGVFMKNPRTAAVYTVPAEGGAATQITPELAYAWHPRFSPDGRRVFFNATYEEPQGVWRTHISWVPSGGGEITRLPMDGDPRVVPAMPGGGYELSPDGRTLVFFGYREGAPREGRGVIWTIPAEGGEPTQLTTTPIQDRFPCWSPDGSSVAFLRYREASEGEYVSNIHVVSATGGEPRQLTTDDQSVAWATIGYSPDGEWIAYFTNDRTLNLLPLGGGEPRILTEVPRADSHAELAWSPDGRKIAYTGRGSIWVVEVESGESTEVLTDVLTRESEEVHIDWSPDGEKIVFSAAFGDSRGLWLISDFLPEGGL